MRGPSTFILLLGLLLSSRLNLHAQMSTSDRLSLHQSLELICNQYQLSAMAAVTFNTGYILVSSILETISGVPWESLMQSRIFVPLQMKETGFNRDDAEKSANRPSYYHENGSPDSKELLRNESSFLISQIGRPAGGIRTTLSDWSLFLIDQLRGSCGLEAHFPPEVYRSMQIANPHEDYALGWMVKQDFSHGGEILMHTGSNSVNYALCWISPKEKFGIAVVTNQSGKPAEKACQEATSMLIRSYHP